MRQIKIITVCGSGVVSSTMVANKLKNQIEDEKGYQVEATEANPGQLEGIMSSGSYDFIVALTPVTQSYDIPIIDGIGYLTGFGEDEVIEEIYKVIDGLDSNN
ncbi:PTS sugar transporter subunit IIB [Clostridium tyrobutyricum]|uniref:PTS sugar transporter subunit IIB n=1 Tax=Clostridium tyrobutyricum TaxID=1519 RepID=UPI002013A840|nr:PTS sugar transporter subunit IIB [Clostridium tyrobutyricum]MBR9647932.1 PTS sugar transporter subunit IIB [Clostridium tyrobutyricum]